MYKLLGLAFLTVHVLTASVPAAELPLQSLARREIGIDHGVFVQSEGGKVLAALNSTRAYHPASVTKVATTLAFLSKLPPDRRFRTTFLAAGTVEAGTLHGDLVVRAEGDPYFLFPNAFRVLLGLREKGVHRVKGAIRVQGPFYFDWTPDPAGRRLKRVWTGRLAAESWRVVTRALFPDASLPLKEYMLRFEPVATRERSQPLPPRPLVVHASPPLRRHLKDFNAHSNDNFHEFSYQVGGPAEVQRILRAEVSSVPRRSIVIDNAAGDGRNNQMSPRAVVAMFQALERTLKARGLAFADVLPVAGVDPGTLEDRLAAARYRGAVVGKSGTVRVLRISTMAGVAYTRKFGRTFFAVMTRGVPLWTARQRQNAFMRGLLDAGGARPLPARNAPPPAFMEARLEAQQ